MSTIFEKNRCEKTTLRPTVIKCPNFNMSFLARGIQTAYCWNFENQTSVSYKYLVTSLRRTLADIHTWLDNVGLSEECKVLHLSVPEANRLVQNRTYWRRRVWNRTVEAAEVHWFANVSFGIKSSRLSQVFLCFMWSPGVSVKTHVRFLCFGHCQKGN